MTTETTPKIPFSMSLAAQFMNPRLVDNPKLMARWIRKQNNAKD